MNAITKNIKISVAIVLAAIFLTATLFLTFVNKSFANPLTFTLTGQTVTATSTAYQIGSGLPALTTSTPVYLDSYANSRNKAFDGATWLIQTTGSTTSSVVTAFLEFAPDTAGVNCVSVPTACDWYQDNLVPTSTAILGNIQGANIYTITTPNLNTFHRAIKVQTPLRYIRATLVASGATSTIWESLVPVQQSQ